MLLSGLHSSCFSCWVSDLFIQAREGEFRVPHQEQPNLNPYSTQESDEEVRYPTIGQRKPAANKVNRHCLNAYKNASIIYWTTTGQLLSMPWVLHSCSGLCHYACLSCSLNHIKSTHACTVLISKNNGYDVLTNKHQSCNLLLSSGTLLANLAWLGCYGHLTSFHHCLAQQGG